MDEVPEDAKRNLRIFDHINKDSKAGRRVAIWAISEYYGSIISDAAEYFDFEKITGQLGPQWRTISKQFRERANIDIPDEYNEYINKLHEKLNRVDHDFNFDPGRGILTSCREMAEEWAKWFQSNLDIYITEVDSAHSKYEQKTGDTLDFEF